MIRLLSSFRPKEAIEVTSLSKYVLVAIFLLPLKNAFKKLDSYFQYRFFPGISFDKFPRQ